MPRRLGSTGPEVSPIGLGMAALGRPGYLTLGHGDDLMATAGDRSVAALRSHAHEVLDAAHAAGVRHVDAARSYGRAEDFLADWLAARPDAAATTTVSTKWGYTYTAEWQVDADTHEVKDHSLATLERQLAEVDERLGAHVDVLQVHSATLATGVLDDVEVHRRLAEVRDSGTVVGLTLSGPRQAATLQRALEVEVDGEQLFGCVQATWNLHERSVGPALRTAHAIGWGVIVKEAVANGRLARWDTAPAVLRDLAAVHDVGVDAVAIAAVLAQPFSDIVLSGAATVDQLASNLDALDLQLTDDELDRLRPMSERPTQYWQRRDGLAWT